MRKQKKKALTDGEAVGLVITIIERTAHKVDMTLSEFLGTLYYLELGKSPEEATMQIIADRHDIDVSEVRTAVHERK